MTLKEFKTDFPVTFQEYSTCIWSKKKNMKVLEKIYAYIDSKTIFAINFIPIIDTQFYKSTLKIKGEGVYMGAKLTHLESKKIVLSKALCYLENGFVE